MGATKLILSPSSQSLAVQKLGVYSGAVNLEGVDEFEAWNNNTPCSFVCDFLAGDYGWGSYDDPNYWGTWSNQPRTLSLSVGMLPTLEGIAVGSMADGAAGAFDSHFTALAQALVSYGITDAYLRIGWEMNGNWFTWQGSNANDWIAYFRRIVTAVRQVNPGFKIDWCPSIGMGSYDPQTLYPGDAYVDVIGLDVYDQSWETGWEVPQSRWTNLINNEGRGLQWHRDFAAQHDKPVSFPEWGLMTRDDGHGGEDNPYFIEQMYNWMNSSNLAYACYFDFSTSYLSGDLYPLSAIKFKDLFKLEPSVTNVKVRVADTWIAPSIKHRVDGSWE